METPWSEKNGIDCFILRKHRMNGWIKLALIILDGDYIVAESSDENVCFFTPIQAISRKIKNKVKQNFIYMIILIIIQAILVLSLGWDWNIILTINLVIYFL